jgi:flagellar basal body-associated protein FliL
MKKLLPIIFLLLGLGGGVGAGILLKKPPEEVDPAVVCGPDDAHPEATLAAAPVEDGEEAVNPFEYLKMNNQFVIPVVTDGKVTALVVLALSLELQTGHKDAIFQREPKLRDIFLQVLFDHANAGGFRGAFTNSNTMDVLRASLRQAGRQALGDILNDVLVTDIVRQDVQG